MRRIAARTTRIPELESELARLASAYAPQLLAERGCGALTAAKLIGEIAGAERFATDAKLARTSGTAPIPASPVGPTATGLTAAGTASSTVRFAALPKANGDPDTAAYVERNQAEGKSRKEALRCLKRHLAHRVWKLVHAPPTPTAPGARAPPPEGP